MAEQEQTPQDAPQAPPSPPAPNGYTCTIGGYTFHPQQMTPELEVLTRLRIVHCTPNP